ncbi:hypothetical protein BYT27DRAFT_7226296 [Phlegmacium glaucopus]|nr:hypothetical protein BYT27DRAFT_7226296 [Phlegmacium glaucopus]
MNNVNCIAIGIFLSINSDSVRYLSGACLPDLPPPLYAICKTFWFEQRSTIFLLGGGLTSPTSLYNPYFFLWDPKALYKDLPCPICCWCVNCLHLQMKMKTVTFRSWDRCILAVLPSALAAEFPVYLSHRSGMSKALFSWMQMSFLSGMGAIAEYLLHYDELHLQYLDYISSNIMMNTWIGKKYQSFLPFHNASPDGCHGFVPRSQWFWDMYDHFMEDHQHEFNQHTAMLSAEICAIDHSHKITKHIEKVNGERVFNGLLTVTNEKGKIQACNLVATKAHSQFEEALKGTVHESLELYGHQQPELFYMDNMADKSFLESSFNSLHENVVPVEKYSSLEPFILPADVQIFWNVILIDTGQHECGKIAIVQIAYENRSIYFNDMVMHQRLPEKLMRSKQLQTLVNSLLPFVGALDLANYTKQHHVVLNARCSLADLCATVLGKQLNKNVSEWTIPKYLPTTLTPLTPVLLFSTDNTVVLDER